MLVLMDGKSGINVRESIWELKDPTLNGLATLERSNTNDQPEGRTSAGFYFDGDTRQWQDINHDKYVDGPQTEPEMLAQYSEFNTKVLKGLRQILIAIDAFSAEVNAYHNPEAFQAPGKIHTDHNWDFTLVMSVPAGTHALTASTEFYSYSEMADIFAKRAPRSRLQSDTFATQTGELVLEPPEKPPAQFSLDDIHPDQPISTFSAKPHHWYGFSGAVLHREYRNGPRIVYVCTVNLEEPVLGLRSTDAAFRLLENPPEIRLDSNHIAVSLIIDLRETAPYQPTLPLTMPRRLTAKQMSR